MQCTTNLFGETVRDKGVLVFHDESGDYGYSKWVFTGLFWICEEHVQEIDKALKAERENENCSSEIHFSEFPKSFNGDYGAKARVARRWLTIYKNMWAHKAWFNVLAVNTRHLLYDKHRFTQNFHAYNRFTAMAVKGGLAWHFGDADLLKLRMYSDEKSRRPQGLLGDGITTDNFEQYLTKRLQEDTQKYKGPKVKLVEPVQCLSCHKAGPFSTEQEIIQLTDLLLGSVATAVERKSDRPAKLWFGKEVCVLMEDIRLKPRNQRHGLHRRFSVSYFPGKSGQIYNDGQLKIRDNENQLRLF